MDEEDPRDILPHQVVHDEQYPFQARSPKKIARKGENDCRVVVNYHLPYIEEDFLSDRVGPIEQEGLMRNNPGATWIVGDAIVHLRSVDFNNLPAMDTHPMGSTR